MAYRETLRVRERKAAQRQALLGAAEALVREGGFAALTVQALALRAEVGVGTVYRYFDAKDQLAAEVFRVATEREVAAVRTALEGDGAVASRLVAAIRVFSLRALRAPRLAWALIAEPVDPAVDEARLIYRAAYRDAFQALIEQGIRTGELPPQPSQLVAAALVGALAEALIGPLAADAGNDELIADITTFCLRATGLPDTTEHEGDRHEQAHITAR
ncbi:TetR/AcrR family transcriptional regulator [Alcanivorax sp. JB21]|uniref:TetR/AcrR family transcriptional regulator n=1 Tax=Alcanivorax limicola TaxID=2874102 RepID=UPI001CBC6B87|nr:TetR/AcrR family transcriptional regulator [Alcanivorax limicola]MBZ2188418.1 TetR/AcrR family transcriptional regulator [Alcanivorax limicola]